MEFEYSAVIRDSFGHIQYEVECSECGRKCFYARKVSTAPVCGYCRRKRETYSRKRKIAERQNRQRTEPSYVLGLKDASDRLQDLVVEKLYEMARNNVGVVTEADEIIAIIAHLDIPNWFAEYRSEIKELSDAIAD